MHDYTETENYEQIYECVCGAKFEETNVVAIRLANKCLLLCPVCNSEQIRCIGDDRGLV